MKIGIKLFLYFLILFLQSEISAQPNTDTKNNIEWEAFPIINYDHDAGIGYGGKGFLFNMLGGKESFDLTLYNSTKGERWYKFVFSYPDMQRRHGKKYPAAFDFTVDYDKWINYKYYYTKFVSPFVTDPSAESETYTREPIEVTALFSRGYLKDFVAELGFRFKSTSSYGFDENGFLKDIKPSLTKYVSLIFNFRVDTRNNLINPQSGYVVEIANEIARDIINPPEQNFYKLGFTAIAYIKLYEGFVIASRGTAQTITERLSYNNKLALGGNNTVRGLPQNRYLSNSSALMNNELRFPIYGRLGGLIGVDLGNSDTTPEWIINPVAGLRFYMDNFVVRFDAGFGKEETGFYFNFGHVF